MENLMYSVVKNTSSKIDYSEVFYNGSDSLMPAIVEHLNVALYYAALNRMGVKQRTAVQYMDKVLRLLKTCDGAVKAAAVQLKNAVGKEKLDYLQPLYNLVEQLNAAEARKTPTPASALLQKADGNSAA